ncbi:beta-prism lectin domain-containing protein [Vibrio aestuarianus]|uniref:Hemolysin n=1 Tax=Vibrio aestuarianus TaxID=28171 RepID=A0A9X4F1G5_9VIBR|nr:beta-prism lectin domain-containing protein [Vibrio aestuarianus]MDE1242755.1 hemolysin [Vibrio aestuarianus]
MTSKYFAFAIGILSLSSSVVHATTTDIADISTQLKWSWNGSSFKPESVQVMMTPVVAQLNDDNGDGKIDNGDVADIIMVTFEGNKYANGGLVRALSGVDGSELWTYANGGVIAEARNSPAVADLDGDGVVEIVTTTAVSQYINVLDNTGNIKKQILKAETGWRSIGEISLADLDGDSSIEILSADGVYNYDTGLLFSHSWAPSSISGDFDGDQVQEVFSGGALYQSSGALDWQYQANDMVWFSSLVNLDSDDSPEVVVSVPASYSNAANSSFAVLEHDGSTKWEINNLSNPGGGVQAVANFLGADSPQVPQVSSQSKVFGYTHHKQSSTIAFTSDSQLWVRSGAAIDAVGSDANSLVGGHGGHLNNPVDLSKVKSIDITSGRYWWGGHHILALDFNFVDGTSTTMGSKHYAFYKKTERLTVPENSSIKGLKAWTAGWLIGGLQFEFASNTTSNEVKGIVYAGYAAVDMYNQNGELVWSSPNDDMNSGKIGVSAYDFDNDGIDEVLVQDIQRVRILDGRTGKELAVIANSTNTLWEYPIVVDLAGDDNAELIVVANDYNKATAINHGVYVYESADSSKPWKNATRIWNQHSFHISNVNQDGTMPTSAEPSWLTHNTYRSSTLRGATSLQSPIFGYELGQATQHTVKNDGELFVRSGLAIDAVGTSLDNLAGGNGGALRRAVDLRQVKAIEVTWGAYYWGGNHIVALKFTYANGYSVTMGSKNYASSKTTDTFHIPQGKTIKQVNVWSQGWLVEGLQFELN